MPNLTEVLKKAAMEAMNASEPAAIMFGTVETINPLSIRIDQKTILTREFLMLTDGVRQHTVSMTVNHYTDYAEGGEGEGSYAEHRHSYSGTKQFIVNNGLTVGDNVLMLRQQGGQLYVVLEKLEEAT